METDALRKQRTEWLVGLFVFFGLAIMGTLILQFGRFSDRVRGHYELTIELPNGGGLRALAPVKMGGEKVGYVSVGPTLKKDFSAVDIKLAIYQDQRIPLGSNFQIGTSGLMGDAFVEILIAEKFTGDFIPKESRIVGTKTADIAELQANAGVILEEVKVAVDEIQIAVKSLNRVFEKVEGDLLGDENVGNLKTTIAELKASSQNIRGATEKLDPVLEDIRLTVGEAKTAVTKAGTTFDTATETLEGIQTTVSKADPAIEELKPTILELRDTIKTANETLEKIKGGNGVAGALISDSGMREDLESFVEKLEAYGILGYPKEKKPGSGIFSGGSSTSSSSKSSKAEEKPKRRPSSLTRRRPGS
ncbi:MAG: MlaD family protein [Verrucomicrobiales bacterium]